MKTTDSAPLSFALEPPAPGAIRAMTLNIVHGTRVSLPSAVFPLYSIQRRLRRIGDVVRHAGVDVLALQEADGDRRIERTREIARHAALSTVLETEGLARHGATLSTRLPHRQLRALRFPIRRLDAKGFVLARLALPSGGEIDVASIHLAAFSRRVRSSQIDSFVAAIREEQSRMGCRPLAVLGDLNDSLEGSVLELARRLDLRTLDPSTPTYTDFGLRLQLDWVLTSPELEITMHRVLPSGLSDHRALVTDLRLRNDSSMETA